jgi:tRNA nucleotidyltransferase (CCA-adding enzyme)
VITLDIKTLDGSKDVVGTKVLKVYEAIIDHLKLNDFKVLGSEWNFVFDNRFAEMYVVVDKDLSRDVEQQGPPLSAKSDYEKFTKKHSGLGHKTFIRGNRVYAIMPRKYPDPRIFLKDLFKEEFISRRIKNIRIK